MVQAEPAHPQPETARRVVRIADSPERETKKRKARDDPPAIADKKVPPAKAAKAAVPAPVADSGTPATRAPELPAGTSTVSAAPATASKPNGKSPQVPETQITPVPNKPSFSGDLIAHQQSKTTTQPRQRILKLCEQKATARAQQMSSTAASLSMLQQLHEYEALVTMAVQIGEQRDNTSKDARSLNGRFPASTVKEKEALLTRFHSRIIAELEWLDSIIVHLSKSRKHQAPDDK